ncbi:MAG: putative FMN-binding protein [Pseudonocardiales bacterium]|nr:putative FMN-binding protein [Pseudonocardiales bacterium]
MKRVILSVLGTIVGLVALLSFKTGGHTTVGVSLPSASLGTTSTSSAATPTPTSSTASGPPNTGQSTTTPSSSPSTPAVTATAKTYNGSAAQTRYGTVQVAVTITGGKITNVAFVQLTSHDGRSADINSQAAPLLLRETLSAQSSNIDTISGATYTSEGYLQSLQSALDQAGIK